MTDRKVQGLEGKLTVVYREVEVEVDGVEEKEVGIEDIR